VLVTGATSGIGLQTVHDLASRGARVIVHGRDAQRVAAVARQLGEEHRGVVADLSSLAEVREMAKRLLTDEERLDVLINNAGTYEPTRRETVDGYELTFQVNHLAPCLLTVLLAPLLVSSAPARVVTVSSGAHVRGKLDFGDLMHEGTYDAYEAYADSKLANVLFTYALSRRFAAHNVVSNCLEPGATDTRMLHTAHPDRHGRPVAEASTGLVCVALDALGAKANATYFYDCRSRTSSPQTYRRTLQEQLWSVSESLASVHWQDSGLSMVNAGPHPPEANA
jgi:NAD(P)-dependent dehydrogenase (short-subunit alcohol dehydrogenase family)